MTESAGQIFDRRAEQPMCPRQPRRFIGAIEGRGLVPLKKKRPRRGRRSLFGNHDGEGKTQLLSGTRSMNEAALGRTRDHAHVSALALTLSCRSNLAAITAAARLLPSRNAPALCSEAY